MFPLNAQISTHFIHFTVDNIFPELLTYMGIHCDAVKCAKIQYHTLHVIVGFFFPFSSAFYLVMVMMTIE